MNYKKICAALAAVMVLASGCSAPQETEAGGAVPAPQESAGRPATDKAAAVEKEETVYAISDAQGNVREIIVSDWLKNAAATGTLQDASNLKDIANVKGQETFTQGADGDILWNTAGDGI